MRSGELPTAYLIPKHCARSVVLLRGFELSQFLILIFYSTYLRSLGLASGHLQWCRLYRGHRCMTWFLSQRNNSGIFIMELTEKFPTRYTTSWNFLFLFLFFSFLFPLFGKYSGDGVKSQQHKRTLTTLPKTIRKRTKENNRAAMMASCIREEQVVWC